MVQLFRPAGRFACTPQPVRIKQIIEENHRIKSFFFDGDLPEAKPGQFVMAWLPRRDEKPFSLADNVPLTLTVANVGPFSEAMHELKVGSTVWFRGPFGRPFEPLGRRPALVGGGYGVAPLAWLASEQRARGQNPIAIIGGRSKADVIGVEKFEEMGVPVLITTNDGSRGEAGLASAPVRRLLENREVDSICGVGPHGLLHALAELAQQYSVPAQLSWEAYMGCAIGLCGMCEHEDGSLLCVEGPVRQLYF
ncbi:MAG: dihydroorotate dehydrogenase electron transfer subunit [Ardenticatenales bacterium]|nr:dihydroorotate dehydrogenase electron transfer subunit [Ardenticatenales bacterium]